MVLFPIKWTVDYSPFDRKQNHYDLTSINCLLYLPCPPPADELFTVCTVSAEENNMVERSLMVTSKEKLPIHEVEKEDFPVHIEEKAASSSLRRKERARPVSSVPKNSMVRTGGGWVPLNQVDKRSSYTRSHERSVAQKRKSRPFSRTSWM